MTDTETTKGNAPQGLAGLIDWTAALAAERYAGGHVEVMRALFAGAAVIGEYVEDYYQGSEAFAYRLPDGRIVLVSDYFGSCSGCDSWEGATDEEARRMLTTLANNATTFPGVASALAWLDGEAQSDAAHYDWRSLAAPLAAAIRKAEGPSDAR